MWETKISKGNQILWITTVSRSRVGVTLTPTAWGVQANPHKSKTFCWIQNLSCCLSVQSLLTLNWIRARAVTGCWSDWRAIRRQRGFGADRWVRASRVMMAVEHIFSGLLFVEWWVPREVVGQRWRLGLSWYQTLTLRLRPETQIKIAIRVRCLWLQRRSIIGS